MSSDSLSRSGRFHGKLHPQALRFSQSVDIDKRLWQVDIRGSLAWAQGLCDADILSGDELAQISAGLKRIGETIEKGEFVWQEQHEDVHLNIEAALIADIGPEIGGKLHTGRSRNDQVATDLRLYTRDAIDRQVVKLVGVCRLLAAMAGRQAETPIPSFTHTQPAQPATLGHHILAWAAPLLRDIERLEQTRARTNVSPLGAAAGTGTGFAVDTQKVARELGFAACAENSMDAVADRDFIADYCYAASMFGVHLSRIAEEWVWWSSPMLGFMRFGDDMSTGSSIMPQKRNPDIAELIRGCGGDLFGSLSAVLMLLKSQPLTYNRDLQNDKRALFTCIDLLDDLLLVLEPCLHSIAFDTEKLARWARKGHSLATEAVDALVSKGMPFREAHHLVGELVAEAEQSGKDVAELDKTTIARIVGAEHTDAVAESMTIPAALSRRSAAGGTAPKQVAAQAKQLTATLQALCRND